MLCVFSQQQIGRGHVYIEYPKSAINTAHEYTQAILRVKCSFSIFPDNFFSCVYEQMVIASGSANNVSLRHSPSQEPCIDMLLSTFSVLIVNTTGNPAILGNSPVAEPGQ